MINLLSKLAKRKLVKEYRLRLGVILLCGVFAVELLAFVFFLPSYYVLTSSVTILATTIEQQQKLTPAGDADVEKQLKNIKSEIDLLRGVGGLIDTPPTELLRSILDAKPRGISVKAFAYARTKTSIDFQLSGVANTRENLLGFQKNLKTNPAIKSIKYGNSFITKKTDIDFSIIISFQ